MLLDSWIAVDKDWVNNRLEELRHMVNPFAALDDFEAHTQDHKKQVSAVSCTTNTPIITIGNIYKTHVKHDTQHRNGLGHAWYVGVGHVG